MRTLLTIALSICVGAITFAQDSDAITRQSTDGIDLVADFHAADEGAPVIIALHMLNSNRAAWTPLLPDLHDAGYAVLNMDMRGHGDSGGTRDWDAIVADVAGWVVWLEENGHLSADGFATLGGSIGANVALISCADMEACRGAVALSPGLDYKATKPLPALESGMTALLMAAHGDRYSAESARELFAGAAGDVTARILPGRAHGTRLFDSDYDAASGMILHWLAEHLPRTENAEDTEKTDGGMPEICGLTDYKFSKRNQDVRVIVCGSVPTSMKPVRVGDCLYPHVDDRDDDGVACES